MTSRFLSPHSLAIAAILCVSPFAPLSAFADETAKTDKEITLSLMADGDAEAPTPKTKWSAKAVRKNDKGLWEYDSTRTAPEGHETTGLEIDLTLPEGFWEINAIGDNGHHGRVVMEVNDKLAGMGWAVSDHGEPYPAEGEPTQWFLSTESDGPILTGAPPIAEASDFELEATVMQKGEPVEVVQASPDSVVRLKLTLPDDFQGTVEMRDAQKPRSTPLFTEDATRLAASAKAELPLPAQPGYYDIRIVDQQRRTVVNHVIHVEE